MRHSLSRLLPLSAALLATLVVTMAPTAPAALAAPHPATSRSATTGIAPNPGVLRVWTPAYMARSAPHMTLAEAVQIAQNFDVIAAKPAEFAPFVSAMKAANPAVTIVAYLNAVMVPSTTAYPSSWYLHDAQGNLIKTVQWNTWAMNPGNPAWVANRVQTCQEELAQSGYDGCFLDSIGRSVADGSGYVDGTPINPLTGRNYTINQFLAQTAALADAVRGAIAPKLVYGNNVGAGLTYFDPHAPTSQLLSHVDVMMSEGFVRKGRAPLDQFNTVKVWLLDVTMLQDAAARGVPLIVVTKAWNTGTAAQKDALHEFALGTFLLGADGSQRFSFLYDESLDPTTYSSWWNAPLGDPTGDYAASSMGLYSRTFANGYVVVNPNGHPRNLTLSTSWTDVQGQTVGPGRVQMPAHTALVLYH